VGTPTQAIIHVAVTAPFDFEAVFLGHYKRVARVIFRIIQDSSRAEELAVDVFWKLWRHASAQGPHSGAWLYQAAVRVALDELRSRTRRERRERRFGFRGPSGNPEQAHEASEERARIRTVLGSVRPQDAQLIVLRAEGFSYQELADALHLNTASVGTMLRRAHESFRKEWVTRYGDT
jgi:RNA polymerase sigma-70 factor (ECF subfamily)